MPQCSRSVIGLIASLTHWLIRSRSFQAWVVNTTSRAGMAGVSHSGAYCAQNSRQPTGARAAAPTDMNSGRSLAAWAGATASAAASAAPARPALSSWARFHFILWPLPVLGVDRSVQCQALGRRLDYSITSSARTSSDGGTSNPSAFAVLRLRIVWYLV